MRRWMVVVAAGVGGALMSAAGSERSREQPGVKSGAQAVPPAKKDHSVWELEGGVAGELKATQAAVRVGEAGACPVFADSKLTPMLRRLDRLVGMLETRDLRLLEAMTPRRRDAAVGPPPDEHAQTLFTFTLCDGGRASEVRRVETVMTPGGMVWGRERGGDAGAGEPQPIDRDKFLSMAEAGGAGGWSWYAGGFEEAAGVESAKPPARVEVVEHPYLAGRYLMDLETMSRRMLGGRTVQIDRADRVLELEKLHVRVPAGYSARHPAGLLVWIDADDECHLPEPLFKALDGAGIVVAGFDRCGNTRPVANRYQLALDAVATVSRRFHIDRRRVYISGISGGGRVASIMQGCFPDVFTGAIPVVGLSSFTDVPMGTGKRAPAAYARPQGKTMDVLRQRRIAAITGARDFNHTEITGAGQVMRGEGLQVKLFEAPEQGHELPKPALFAEALAFVDEPWQRVRAAEMSAAQKEWESRGKAVLDKVTEGKVVTDADRAALVHITEWAWTPGAWRAVETLRRVPKP